MRLSCVDEQLQEIFGDRIVYTVAEAKMFLIISRTGMYDLVELKLFPSAKVNNQIYIPADLFHEWAEEQQYFSLNAEYDLRKEMMAKFKGCFFNQQEGKGEPIKEPKAYEDLITFPEDDSSESDVKPVVFKDVKIDDVTIPVATTSEDDTEVILYMPEDIARRSKQEAEDAEARLLEHLKQKYTPVVKPEEKNYYTVQEAARILKCHYSRIYKLIDTQTIRSKKIGPRVLIFKKEFDEWYKNRDE